MQTTVVKIENNAHTCKGIAWKSLLIDFAAAAYPRLYHQGKGIVFNLADEKRITNSAYRPYLKRIVKAIKKMIDQATKTKNKHSKDDPITRSETALELATASDHEHTMNVIITNLDSR